MYAKAYLKPSRTSTVDVYKLQASLRKLQKSFVLDVWPCSKYTSGVGFTVEKVFRMSIYVWYYQSLLQKIVFDFLFLEFIKTS